MEFGPEIRDGLDQLFRWRRDVRHFQPTPIQSGLIEDLLRQADTAPSVGLSQPWRWVRVTSPERRAMVRRNFQAANSDALARCRDDRRQIYARLKLSGLDEAPEHLAVFCDEATSQGAGLGAQSMPETRRYSVICAIFQLWLAARARGLGLGWVSILSPDQLTRDLDVPDDWHFIAYLCLGYPQETHDDPELERAGWESRRTVKPLIR
ncbi:MAG: 5,6-dimethylbenzimidazole synthase [Pseudomonadota bacterium]